jgi:phage repressor protein C with HTH and peptisase S24 domain
MTSQDYSFERLAKLRQALGMTYREFADPLGVSHTAVRRWETGEAELTKLAGLAIEHTFGASCKWLLDGEGLMWLPKDGSHQEDALVYRPVIQGAASCGPGGEITDPGPTAPSVPFRREFLQQLLRDAGSGSLEDLFIVECHGESMRPTIIPGDQVIVSTALSHRLKPKRGALYLVRPDPNSTNGKIKRIRLEEGNLWFLSDAPGFAPFPVEVDGVPIQSLVLGRVCWVSRTVLKEDSLEMAW